MYSDLCDTRPVFLRYRDENTPDIDNRYRIEVNMWISYFLYWQSQCIAAWHILLLNFCLISHTFIPYFQLGRMPLEVKGSVLFVQLQDLPICFFWVLAALGIGINPYIGRKPVFSFLLRIDMMQWLITWTLEPGCIDLNLSLAIYMLVTLGKWFNLSLLDYFLL